MTTFETYHTRLTGQTFVHLPERVVVDEMDRARRLIEDAERIHDTLACEVGYDRVRIEKVRSGDVIRDKGRWEGVSSIVQFVEPDGFDSGWRVATTGGDDLVFDAGQMVCRKRTEPQDEAF